MTTASAGPYRGHNVVLILDSEGSNGGLEVWDLATFATAREGHAFIEGLRTTQARYDKNALEAFHLGTREGRSALVAEVEHAKEGGTHDALMKELESLKRYPTVWVNFMSDLGVSLWVELEEPFEDYDGVRYEGGYVLRVGGETLAHVVMGSGPYDRAHVFRPSKPGLVCMFSAELDEGFFDPDDPALLGPRRWCEERLVELADEGMAPIHKWKRADVGEVQAMGEQLGDDLEVVRVDGSSGEDP